MDGTEIEQIRQLRKIEILLLNVIFNAADHTFSVILHHTVAGDLPEHFLQLCFTDIKVIHNIRKMDIFIDIFLEIGDHLANQLIFISQGIQRQRLHL